jgi:hypothetical protein
MGLDQYANYRIPEDSVECNTEMFRWRKHQPLQNWMENIWWKKKETKTEGDKFIDGLDGRYDDGDSFNCVEVEVTSDDLDNLECDISEINDGDDYYLEQDRKFIVDARKKISEGYEIYYSSWW